MICWWQRDYIKINLHQLTKIFLKTSFLLSIFFCAWIEAAASLSDIRVIDGDTVHAVHNGEKIKIRLAEIDAPEMDQPFGQKSKSYLSDLLRNKSVTFISNGKGSWGRVLATIYANQTNVNNSMVKFGMAWVYDKYVKNYDLYKDQNLAKDQNLGLWSQSSPIAPWEWRKKNR